MTPEQRAGWIEEVVPTTKPFAPEFREVFERILHDDRREVIEKCAKVADRYSGQAAAMIRALREES